MYRTLFYNRWKFDSPPPPPPPFARLRTLSPCSGFLLFLGKTRPPSASPLLIVCLSVCTGLLRLFIDSLLDRSVARPAVIFSQLFVGGCQPRPNLLFLCFSALSVPFAHYCTFRLTLFLPSAAGKTRPYVVGVDVNSNPVRSVECIAVRARLHRLPTVQATDHCLRFSTRPKGITSPSGLEY
jgi:hypothetical protein